MVEIRTGERGRTEIVVTQVHSAEVHATEVFVTEIGARQIGREAAILRPPSIPGLNAFPDDVQMGLIGHSVDCQRQRDRFCMAFTL